MVTEWVILHCDAVILYLVVLLVRMELLEEKSKDSHYLPKYQRHVHVCCAPIRQSTETTNVEVTQSRLRE